MFESSSTAFHSVFGDGDNAAQKSHPASAPALVPAPTAAPVHASPPGHPATPAATSGGAAAPAASPAAATKPVDKKAMAEAANNIFKSMDGWWVSGGDQAKVLGT